MRTRAAALFEQPGEWRVIEVDLEEPHDDEVLIRLVATGLCHSDYHWAKGNVRPAYLPVVGGHEGAGVVEAVGKSVKNLAVGDHVVSTFIPACGRCRWCANGQQNLCDNGALMFAGTQLDGSFRMSYKGTPVGQSCMLATFSEWTVSPEWSWIKIDPSIPLRSAALVGCGVPTGWGSAVNAAAVQVGDVVVVMGVGGLGINAVQGARHCGAGHIVAVDPLEFKQKTALDLGATNAFGDIATATEFVKSVTNGQGADSAILTMGTLQPQDTADAFNVIRKGGIVVVTASGDQDMAGIPVNLLELTMYQKRIQGSLYGMNSPSKDLPRLLGLYQVGLLKLDELVTRTYKLDEINQGYADLESGLTIRGVVDLGSA